MKELRRTRSARHTRDEAAGNRTGAGLASYAPPQYSYAKIPACSGNDINAGIDVPCEEAATACGVPGQYQYWLFRGRHLLTIGEPGWTRVGTFCSSPDTPGTDPLLPGFTLTDFQRLPLPAGTSTVEPPGGNVLVGMPTNVYATPSSEPALFDTTMLGVPVQVRATAARWSWDFGDTTDNVIGPTTDPGAAYPALRNTHTYTARGTYPITMTTHYTGEYSVAGGPWLPIPGEAQVDSPPTTVQALAGRNELVAEPRP